MDVDDDHDGCHDGGLGAVEMRELESRRAVAYLLPLILGLSACATVPPPAAPGKAVPNLSFALTDGSEMTTEKTRGDVLVIAFFTIWCPASAKALEAVEEIRVRNKGAAGLTVVAVNEGDPPEDVAAFIAKQGVKTRVAFDKGGAVASQIGLPTMPSVVVIDRAGLIRQIFAGYHSDDDRLAMGNAVSAVLAEETVAPTE